MSKTRHPMSFALLRALCALCGFISACSDSSEPSAVATREVVVLTPHGQELLDDFEEAFEAAYPDIDVVGRFVPSRQVLAQLRIDKESPRADVWWGGTSALFSQGKAEGLIAPYRPSWAEASREGYHDVDDTWYAQFLQVPAVMFNSNIYTEDQMPATWEELLAPEWKDKIVIREVLDSGTMRTIFTGLIWRSGGEMRDPKAGYEFLEKLDAQTRSYLPNPQALYDRIGKSAAGYISLWNLTDIVYQSEVNGYPFGARVPSDPVPVSLDPIAIVAGAPNRTEAELFYEFVTSKENCIKLARDHYRILARDDIDPEDLPARMTAIRFEPMPIDLAEFDRLQVEWMRHWREEIRDPEK